MRRMVAIIKMAPGIDPSSWDHKDEAMYGLGTARKVEDFYRIFGMDVHAKKVCSRKTKHVKPCVCVCVCVQTRNAQARRRPCFANLSDSLLAHASFLKKEGHSVPVS
jgi:hypothetical protein